MHLQHFALILSFLLSADVVLSDSGSGWTHELAKGYHPTGRDSGALFNRNGAPYLFGGYTEKISFTFDPPQVFFNDLHMYNETAKAWHQIYGATPSVPTERAIFCSAYDPETDSYYVAQGTNYTSDFTQFTYFNDTWKFSFASKTWTRLNSAVVPPGRGGVDCAIQNGNLWMMGGAIFNTSDGNRYVYNDLWKMNLTTGQWTLVRPNTFVNCFADYTACPNPIQRQQHKVLALDDNRRIVIGYGTTFDLSGTNIPLADIWIYDTWANTYQQLDSLPSSPQPIREFSAWTILPGSTRSKGGIIMFGGDAQGAVNASNNCDPIAICIFPNTPTDQTFYYSFGDQEWSLLPIENTTPLNRKGMITATVPQGRDFHNPLKNAKIWHFGGRTDYVGPANRGTVRYDLLWSLDNLHKY